MTSLQGPGRQNSPEAFSDLVHQLVSIKRELNDATSSLLRTAGIRVRPEGMTIERALEVLGSLDVSGDLDVTGSATFSGDTTIGGNAAITGTLSLPAGIIDNEALASPVRMGSNWAYDEGFAIPTATWTSVANATIEIPQGFTRLQFTAVGMVNGRNSTASTQNMYVRVIRQINDTGPVFDSPQGQIPLVAGFNGVASATYIWGESVNPGEVHRFTVQVWVSNAFAATTSNYGRIDISALFTR